MKKDKLNYIKQINGFWRFYDENIHKISVSDIILYIILLRYCNKLNWLNPFDVNPFLMSQINPLSKNTYYKSLKNLNSLKLIKWTKGKHNISNQRITILNIETSIVTSINNSIDTSIRFSNETSIVNNNKTIKQINNNTIKQFNNKDFDILISSNEFKDYLETKNLNIEKTDIEKPKISENDILEVYQTYPTKDKNNNNRGTGKTKKVLPIIKKLLTNEYEKENLINIINRYISECEKTKTYIKNFTTFLNNIPDYETIEKSVELYVYKVPGYPKDTGSKSEYEGWKKTFPGTELIKVIEKKFL
ncbi:MAG: hypothetical protein GY849_02560 [Deltaproteobacteria bacterium]|nr:hypothetical protein [Deltaproteobacteria bacterium]